MLAIVHWGRNSSYVNERTLARSSTETGAVRTIIKVSKLKRGLGLSSRMTPLQYSKDVTVTCICEIQLTVSQHIYKVLIHSQMCVCGTDKVQD